MIDVRECKTYRYDAIEQATSILFTIGGTSTPGTPNRTTTYDPNARVQKVAQAGSGGDSDIYAYDLDGRLLSVSKPDSSISYAYYDDGKRQEHEWLQNRVQRIRLRVCAGWNSAATGLPFRRRCTDGQASL